MELVTRTNDIASKAPSRSMTTKGFGPDTPRYANDTRTNKAKNRRTELKVTKR